MRVAVEVLGGFAIASVFHYLGWRSGVRMVTEATEPRVRDAHDAGMAIGACAAFLAGWKEGQQSPDLPPPVASVKVSVRRVDDRRAELHVGRPS